MNDKSHCSWFKSEKKHIGYAYTQIKASNIQYTKIVTGIFPIMTGIFPIMNSRFSHLHIMMQLHTNI